MATVAVDAGTSQRALLSQVTWWILALPLVMLVALGLHDLRLLNWTHVLAGILWTGADIFMGFILGPVMGRLRPEQRSGVVAYLVPKNLLYFPAVSLTTSTAGWYLATWLGFTNPANPQFPWIIAALVLITLMTLIGLGILLPNSVRMWLELRRPQPNHEYLFRLTRINIALSGAQGIMQVAIIVVMSHLVVG